MILATDASETTVAYILGHPEADDVQVVTPTVIYSPMSFGGRTLSNSESRYASPEKEVLAVVEGVRKFHHFVRDITLHVFTDHAALLNYANGVSVNPRIIKWLTYLSDFDVVFHHRRREEAKDADGLTRSRWKFAPSKTMDEILDKDDEGFDVTNTQPNPLYTIGLLEVVDEIYDGIKRLKEGLDIGMYDEAKRK